MRLTNLQLTNFQAIDSLTLGDLGPLNVLIGPPHSGKTSILESLYFQFHHEGLQDAKAYFQFLNRSLASGQFYSIVSTFDDSGASFRCSTTVRLEGTTPRYENRVWRETAALSDDDAAAFRTRVRSALKFLATPHTDKRMYFPEPDEPDADRRQRLLAELASLANSPRYRVFTDGIRTVFPHLPAQADPQAVQDFFGTGFAETLKLFIYLYHPSFPIVLIDEPEIYLYADLTHRFLRLVAHEVRTNPDKQVLIASHAPVLLNQPIPAATYLVTRQKSGQAHVARVSHQQLVSQFDIFGAKPADVITSEMVIYVEGPSDIGVFEEFLKKFPELRDTQISVFQLGGDAMGHDEVDPVKLKQHNPFSFAVIDSERHAAGGSPEPAHQRFIDRCYDAKLYCMMLERAAIENYFTPHALQEYYRGRHIAPTFTNHPYRTLKRQGIGMYEKGHARGIAALMTRADIESFRDLRAFFQELISVVQKSS